MLLWSSDNCRGMLHVKKTFDYAKHSLLAAFSIA
jgi:hypothetical protein